jgi:exonuclease VII small subunit
MDQIITRLRALSSAKLSKAKLDELRELGSSISSYMETVVPTSEDENAAADFEDVYNDLEEAVESLESGCECLEDAEGRDEREEALEQIASALDEAATQLEELKKISTVSALSPEVFDKELLAFLRQCVERNETDLGGQMESWVVSAPDVISKRGRRAAATRFQEAAASRRDASA